jgi:hypothetical protein
MSDPTRARINTAFDEELGAAPVPGGLRALSVHGAVTAGRSRAPQPALLALIAAVVMVAIVVTLVVGSNALRHNPAPSRSRPAPSALPPSPRAEANLAYDGAHGELVLFGGAAIPGGDVNETWTWDGKAWRLYHVSGPPAPRSQAAMAYDEAHRNVVLFGGMAHLAASGKAGDSPVSDTWTWDGSTWKELHPRHEPSLDYSWPPSMEYDPASRAVLLFGFKKTPSEGLTNMTPQTWSWNGSDWTLLSPAASPTQVGRLAAYRGHVYLMAFGAGRIGGRYVTDLWRWDQTTWTPAGSFAQPFGGSMVDDQSRGLLIVFDGDTWTFDGSTWTRQHPQTVPPSGGYMAYFPPLHEVVMWGDVNGVTNNAIWAWDGADWKQVAAGTMPPVSPPAGTFGPETPGAAAAFIRQTVKTACAVLLPTSLPAGMEASGLATADFFSVDYRSDQRDRTISLAAAVANPPPGDDRSSDRHVAFRGGTGEYFVYDAGAPRSDRWLMWSVGFPKTDGCPYFLSASGLTDSEFWQVANSLR